VSVLGSVDKPSCSTMCSQGGMTSRSMTRCSQWSAGCRRGGTRCYLATISRTSVRRTCGRCCIRPPFRRAFYSCELGVAKPDGAYFTAILDRLALSPDRCSSSTQREERRSRSCSGLTAWVYNPRTRTRAIAHPAGGTSAPTELIMQNRGRHAGRNPNIRMITRVVPATPLRPQP